MAGYCRLTEQSLVYQRYGIRPEFMMFTGAKGTQQPYDFQVVTHADRYSLGD
jgi:hypothetical protein